MSDMDPQLEQRLDAIREAGLYRQPRRVQSPQGSSIVMGGRRLLSFASNDYLGLANEPALKEAACRAVNQYGAGAGASRLISGSLPPHGELEELLAEFHQAQAALSFSSGYATATGTLGALLEKNSVVVLDRLVHASLVDAARLSGATLRVFRHNDPNHLEQVLKSIRERRKVGGAGPQRAQPPPLLIVTESVFSMDGDLAPLRELVELKERYGAWLMVDEAHATGLYGDHRRGLAESLGVADRIEVHMGTLGKALGAAGGYITGSRALIDLLFNRARSFIFSTAPVPAAAAAATAGVRFVQTPAGEQRCRDLWARVAEWAVARGGEASPSPIRPLILGEEKAAVEAAIALDRQGFFVPAVRYPTVARGAARLRVTLTASHTAAEVAALCAALQSL
jgi:8-amino-7-oxononanoate synthase